MSLPSADIITKAESLPGVKAGIASLDELLEAPSYQAVSEGTWSTSVHAEPPATDWPSGARSVLVLGLHHPEDEPRLDWWDEDHSPGDRRLMATCESLKGWFHDDLGIVAFPLPYAVERGGVFLKDAAALAGLGVFGRNNLLITPEWGPRIRFRAILLEEDLEPTGPLQRFAPCQSCDLFCQRACPRNAFAMGVYHRPACAEQMVEDVEHASPARGPGEDGSPRLATKYCRACELACPVGL